MSAATVTFDTKDVERTIKMLNKAGKSPQKAVTRAAGRAGTVLKRAVKGEVPYKTGTLKRSIVRVGEKSRRKGKKVYQVTFDRKMNDELQRPVQNPGMLGGKSSKGYYPASMEYGFLARAKDGSGGVVYYSQELGEFRTRTDRTPQGLATQKVEGHEFLEKAGNQVEPEIREIMINKTLEELEKIWTAK